MLVNGWIDSVRRIHPEKGVYAYWNFSFRGGYNRSSRLRMDHLVVTPHSPTTSAVPVLISQSGLEKAE